LPVIWRAWDQTQGVYDRETLMPRSLSRHPPALSKLLQAPAVWPLYRRHSSFPVYPHWTRDRNRACHHHGGCHEQTEMEYRSRSTYQRFQGHTTDLPRTGQPRASTRDGDHSIQPACEILPVRDRPPFQAMLPPCQAG